MRSSFDFVIVGGGSAGCVIARRLAEDPDIQVLLIEAGPSDDDDAIRNLGAWPALLGGRYDWGYSYAPTPRINNRVIPIPRGRVLGGSSSINAGTWYRGHRSDYDAWEQAGATGWNYQAVLPYFRRAENWQGPPSAMRGTDGPMHIEHPNGPHPLALAMLDGARQIGIPVVDDYNGPSNEGATLTNLNMRDGRRWSTVDGYLKPAADWPNLTVLTDSTALDLVFDGVRCVGVRHVVAGQIVITRAEREVVLTLGAIGSPRMLMLSGIGDPAELRGLGIPVRAVLPGVGQNLQDHPLLMGINFRSNIPLGPVSANGGGAQMNWRSRPEEPVPDLHAFIAYNSHATPEIAAAHDFSGNVFAISPGLVRSRSRGYLRLLGTAPDAIEIQPNFLAEPADLAALAQSIETIMDLADAPAYRNLIAGHVAPRGRLTLAERIAFVRDACSTFFHTCGTCAMGTGDGAVVDPDLRVRGVDGLRVADASVIPIIPTCNTQAPVVMIAERAAAFLREGKSP